MQTPRLISPPPRPSRSAVRKPRRTRTASGCGIVGLLAGIIIVLFGVALFTLTPTGLLINVAGMVDGPAGSNTSPVTFSISEGETATAIGERLERAGLIRSALLFRTMARAQGVEGKLEAGDYELNRSMTTAQVLERLQKGRRDSPVLTVPEGWRAAEIATRLDQIRPGLGGEFRTHLNARAYTYTFLQGLPPTATVEGYLFPDTYQVGEKVSAPELVATMLGTFEKNMAADVRRQPYPRNLSLHQIMTLASIVEREARKPEERAVIAGVFLNRLARNMPLQADPTVQYALVELKPESVTQFGYWKTGLTRSDLNTDSPYNTYRYNGLPPAPICNPGAASIRAALQPAQTDYIYFVAKPDGSHAFARTLEEHNENVRKYQP